MKSIFTSSLIIGSIFAVTQTMAHNAIEARSGVPFFGVTPNGVEAELKTIGVPAYGSPEHSTLIHKLNQQSNTDTPKYSSDFSLGGYDY